MARRGGNRIIANLLRNLILNLYNFCYYSGGLEGKLKKEG